MKYDPHKHHRRSIRLKGFDYSREGWYFLTMVTYQRECLFGEVVEGEMILNEAGELAVQCWLEIPIHFPNAELDEFVIMPDHVHGIIHLMERKKEKVRAKNHSPVTGAFRSPSKTVGSIVRGFKIGVTKWVRQNMDVKKVWHRNYYEHVIRSEADLNRIRKYIIENPLKYLNDT